MISERAIDRKYSDVCRGRIQEVDYLTLPYTSYTECLNYRNNVDYLCVTYSSIHFFICVFN